MYSYIKSECILNLESCKLSHYNFLLWFFVLTQIIMFSFKHNENDGLSFILCNTHTHTLLAECFLY